MKLSIFKFLPFSVSWVPRFPVSKRSPSELTWLTQQFLLHFDALRGGLPVFTFVLLFPNDLFSTNTQTHRLPTVLLFFGSVELLFTDLVSFRSLSMNSLVMVLLHISPYLSCYAWNWPPILCQALHYPQLVSLHKAKPFMQHLDTKFTCYWTPFTSLSLADRARRKANRPIDNQFSVSSLQSLAHRLAVVQFSFLSSLLWIFPPEVHLTVCAPVYFLHSSYFYLSIFFPLGLLNCGTL